MTQQSERMTGMLDASIGGFTTLRIEILKSAARRGGSNRPNSWVTNKLCEELEREGLIAECDTENPFMRNWKITDKGRAALSSGTTGK